MGSNLSNGEERKQAVLTDWRGGPVMVGDVVLHSDIITEFFCCDISQCHGSCCEEGDAGAPVTTEEIAYIEGQLDRIWPHMSAGAQTEVDRHGVAYCDPEGELVTSIVNGGNCVFRGCNGCLLPLRPISCHLYPIRERRTGPYVALNYHRWGICQAAVALGRKRGIHVYQFLREPLIRRFGEAWYAELELTVRQMYEQGLLI